MFGDSGMVEKVIAFDVVFAIAVCIGIGVLLLPPGERGSTFAKLVLYSKMAAASSIERILLGLLRTV